MEPARAPASTRRRVAPPLVAVVVVMVAVTLVGIVGAPTVAGQELAAQQVTTTTTAASTTTTAPVVGDRTDPQAWHLGLLVLTLSAFVLVPLLVDVIAAHRQKRKVLEALLQGPTGDGLERRELEDVLSALSRSPAGMRGLARSVMALSIVVLLGMGIFYVLVVGAPAGDRDLIERLLSPLTGALAAIIGFYYGGRAADDRVERPPARSGAPSGDGPGTASGGAPTGGPAPAP